MSLNRSSVVVALLCVWLAAEVRGAAPSDSKLSIHLLSSYTAGASQIIQANPRVIKILDTSTPMLSAVRAYKASTPGGKVVLRAYFTKSYTLTQDPTWAANDLWTTVLRPRLQGLSAADRALIDYVEGPNEGEGTPTFVTQADAVWYNAFWLELAQLISDAGHRPCAYSIAVGNPGGSLATIQQRLSALLPSLRKVHALGGAWSYHAYSLAYSKNLGVESWTSLRYRIFYSYFEQAAPDLLTLPLILTEGGIDDVGNPATSGWAAKGTAAQYQDWLAWFDDQLQKDPYVVGCTLFQIGGYAQWPSFDLEPVAPWIANRLQTHAPPPPIGRSPGVLNVSTVQGSDAAPVAFTVWNAGTGTLNYTISDNVAWLAVSPASGSSVGDADTISVTFSTAELPVGNYIGTISIGEQGGQVMETVVVNLTMLVRPIPGDLDGDRDVDEMDVGALIRCIGGAGVTPPAGCEMADLDGDGDVDAVDFGRQQRHMSGAGIPASAE